MEQSKIIDTLETYHRPMMLKIVCHQSVSILTLLTLTPPILSMKRPFSSLNCNWLVNGWFPASGEGWGECDCARWPSTVKPSRWRILNRWPVYQLQSATLSKTLIQFAVLKAPCNRIAWTPYLPCHRACFVLLNTENLSFLWDLFMHSPLRFVFLYIRTGKCPSGLPLDGSWYPKNIYLTWMDNQDLY